MQKINEIIKNIKPLDEKMMQQAKIRQDNLTKPRGSLGRLEELAIQVAGITSCLKPVLKKKVIFTLAADHGVVEERVSAYPKEVTEQMVYNFLSGGAGINILVQHTGCKVVIVDVGVDAEMQNVKCKMQNFKNKKITYGTKNIRKGEAMTKDQAIKSIEVGIELVEEELSNSGIDIIGTGDMGIGNTTPSAAITAFITGAEVEEITGRGTGINDEMLKNKINVIKEAIKINSPNKDEPIDILSKLGGFEIGGLTGIILAGAANRIPIVIDGFISGAAALIAYELSPLVKDYLIAAHLSEEKGHKILLDYIGLKPLLNLNMRLGEGTAAALGIFIVEAACKILTEMKTFAEAGVSEEINKINTKEVRDKG